MFQRKYFLKDFFNQKFRIMGTKLLKRYWPAIAGAAIGALGGYLYWCFVGCEGGSCAITSSPVNSSLWGAVMGGLVADLFIKDKKTETDE